MSKTLFSTHVYFLKKDFVFIVDLAVLTASFIKTFKEIDTFSILWILPNQHYFSILKRHYLAKKPGYPQLFFLDFNTPHYNLLIPHSHYLGKNTSH